MLAEKLLNIIRIYMNKLEGIRTEYNAVESQMKIENQAMLEGFSRGATLEELTDVDPSVAAVILQQVGDAWRFGSEIPEILKTWIEQVDIEKMLEGLLLSADHVPEPIDQRRILVLGPDGNPSEENILLEGAMKELDLISSALLVLTDLAIKRKFDCKHSPAAQKLSKTVVRKIRGWKKITTAHERISHLGERENLGQVQATELLGSKYPKLLE
jgi:hypothetical protein